MNNFSSNFIIKPSGITDDGQLVINSWKKAIKTLVFMMLPGIIITTLILFYFSQNIITIDGKILPIMLAGIAFSAIVNGISIYSRFYKRRLVIDHYGITIYFGKDTYEIHWETITEISVSTETRSELTKPADYYRILLLDYKDYPFDDIIVEKTSDVEEDIARYYRK